MEIIDRPYNLATPECWENALPDQIQAHNAVVVLNALKKQSENKFAKLFHPEDMTLGRLTRQEFEKYTDEVGKQATDYLNAVQLVDLNTVGVNANCRINTLSNSPIFIATDPPERAYKGRVFPYSDEAETMLQMIDEFHKNIQPRRILDICCGAGSIGLELARRYREQSCDIYGVDNSGLAISYARFNRVLNQLPRFDAAKWDVEEGIEQFPYGDLVGGVDLITADPPFAAHPPWVAPYKHSEGGEHSDHFTNILLELVPDLLGKGGTFAMITYSLGNKKGPVELNDKIRDVFPKNEFTYKKPVVIPDAKLWRLYGKKRYPRNPMEVQFMAPRFFDPSYQNMYETENHTYEHYTEWINDSLIAKGYTHLYYVFVSITRKN